MRSCSGLSFCCCGDMPMSQWLRVLARTSGGSRSHTGVVFLLFFFASTRYWSVGLFILSSSRARDGTLMPKPTSGYRLARAFSDRRGGLLASLGAPLVDDGHQTVLEDELGGAVDQRLGHVLVLRHDQFYVASCSMPGGLPFSRISSSCVIVPVLQRPLTANSSFACGRCTASITKCLYKYIRCSYEYRDDDSGTSLHEVSTCVKIQIQAPALQCFYDL